jgi:MoaA/NifB/PqqE/SkfB family radical SAM enzyme
MYRATDIRQLHIEASTRCNAACPMCCRNLNGRTSPGLAEQSMSLTTFQRAIPPDLARHLAILDICGAYGDPVMAPDLMRIIRHVRRLNPGCEVRVFTNGGLRDEQWWSQLGAFPGVAVIFAIDGLSANHVYRRKVNTRKVLRNAEAFIKSGGQAQWDYIVFEHNEHEVTAARRLSESLGFQTFAVKRTARFLRPLYEPSPEVSEVPCMADPGPDKPRDGVDRA